MGVSAGLMRLKLEKMKEYHFENKPKHFTETLFEFVNLENLIY